MNVLLISDALIDGGTNQLIHHLLCVVSEYSNIHASVLLNQSPAMTRFQQTCSNAGISVYLKPIYHGLNEEAVIQANLQEVIEKEHPDAVHVFCSSIRSCIAIREYIIKIGIPLYFTEAYLPEAYPVIPGEIARIQRIYANAKAAIMVCRSNLDCIRNVYGIADENLYCIPTSIDTSATYTRSQKITLPGRALILGRLTRQKGVDVFLEAYRNMPAEYCDLVCVDICGEGEDRVLLEDMIHRYGLEKQVRLLGYCPDIMDRLGEYEFAIVPSRDEGGLPHVVLELLNSGMPCIVSNASGLKEAVDFGKHGLMFEAGSSISLQSKLEMVIQTPSVLEKAGSGARNYIREHYDRTKNYCRILELWNT